MNDFRRSRIKLLQNAKNAKEACIAKLYNFDFAKNMLDDLQPSKYSMNLSKKMYIYIHGCKASDMDEQC
ncbi:hypothetical protein IEQ34_026927 [Dendrobium chrysotoxum]|uniref:Uncharacterized protein n=1 Tax=Dendrobium chrysotoxum TaxID=161865 RepID=A0AAV7FL13_DENCH|nr:hypothetical protein IEQ34_026927 [Dendrobium chrysotoxum]